jgi:hypothetical protein
MLYNYVGNRMGSAVQLGGTSATDMSPGYYRLPDTFYISNDNTLTAALAPVSITVFTF